MENQKEFLGRDLADVAGYRKGCWRPDFNPVDSLSCEDTPLALAPWPRTSFWYDTSDVSQKIHNRSVAAEYRHYSPVLVGFDLAVMLRRKNSNLSPM